MDYMPVLSEVVDIDWRPDDLKRLAWYLKECPVAISAGESAHECPLCGGHVEHDPSAHRSDGEWVWPDDLWHLVEVHHVRLPDDFVRRIRDREYRIPTRLDIPLHDIEWPNPDYTRMRALRERVNGDNSND